MKTASEVFAYAEGITAGGKWFNDGIDKGLWNPPENPYQKNSPEADQWERGLYTGFEDLNDAYYA